MITVALEKKINVVNIRTGIFHYVLVRFGPAGGYIAQICSKKKITKINFFGCVNTIQVYPTK
jgi:hypothetical protein